MARILPILSPHSQFPYPYDKPLFLASCRIRSGKMNAWKRRYICISRNCLYYYLNEEGLLDQAAEEDSEYLLPTGVVPLWRCDCVVCAEEAKKILYDPNFTFEAVNRSSRACGPLYMWGKSQLEYAYHIQRVKPLNDAMEGLTEKSEALRQEHGACMERLSALNEEIERCSSDYGVQAQKVLLYVLTETLKLLHPFMPFITEEIYQALPHEGDALMVQPYPVYREDMAFPAESARFEKVMEAIRAIRSRRSEMNVPPSKRPHLYIVTEEREAFENGRDYLCRLAYAGEVIVSDDVPADADKMVSIVTKDARCFLPMSELVDLDKERERLEKELAKNRGFLENQRRKLSNESFVSRAPANVVATERERAEKLEALIANLEESLRQLG